MYIADIKLKNNLILAPMAGISDKVFRNICAHFGAGMVFTEMVSANGLAIQTPQPAFCSVKIIQAFPAPLRFLGTNPNCLPAPPPQAR